MPKRNHRQSVVDHLREDPTYAIDYVNAALEDGDDSGFLKALRNVAESKSMSKIAAEADVQRESLYKMLSETGNPRLSSLFGVLKALGLRIIVTSTQPEPKDNEPIVTVGVVDYK